MQHARLPCSPPAPGAYSNSCASSRWCHPTISSSVFPFSCFQSFPEWGAFPASQFFTSHGQGASDSASDLISFKIDWFDFLAVQGTLKSLLQHHSSKASVLQHSAFFMVQLAHPYMTTGKTIVLTRHIFVSKVMSLLFNMLSRLVIALLPRSKCLLISWLQSPPAVIWEPMPLSPLFPRLFAMKWLMGPDAMIFLFWILSFKPAFSFFSFTFIKRLFSSSSFSAIRVVSSACLRLLIFLPAILIPAYTSSSPAFRMMYSAYKLNKQGDNIQPWHTPYPIWNQSIVLGVVLTVASCPAFRFLRRQVRWFGIPISLRIFHTLLWSTQSKALA